MGYAVIWGRRTVKTPCRIRVRCFDSVPLATPKPSLHHPASLSMRERTRSPPFSNHRINGMRMRTVRCLRACVVPYRSRRRRPPSIADNENDYQFPSDRNAVCRQSSVGRTRLLFSVAESVLSIVIVFRSPLTCATVSDKKADDLVW